MKKWDYIIETIEQNFNCKYNYNDTQGMHEFDFGDEVLSFYDNFNDHGEAEILNEFGSAFKKIADEIKYLNEQAKSEALNLATIIILQKLHFYGYELINVDDYEILRYIASDYNAYDTTQQIIDDVYNQLMLTSDRVCKSNCIR